MSAKYRAHLALRSAQNARQGPCSRHSRRRPATIVQRADTSPSRGRPFAWDALEERLAARALQRARVVLRGLSRRQLHQRARIVLRGRSQTVELRQQQVVARLATRVNIHRAALLRV